MAAQPEFDLLEHCIIFIITLEKYKSLCYILLKSVEAAEASGVYPELLLAATTDSTKIWDRYAKCHCPGILGGMHHNRRELFEHI